MKITREQFIRGFNALRSSFARQTAMNLAAKTAGIEDYDHGQDPVAYELQRQLEERCDDTTDDKYVGSMISYGLHERGECTPFAGAQPYLVNDAESVWRFWMHSKTGPFAEAQP